MRAFFLILLFPSLAFAGPRYPRVIMSTIKPKPNSTSYAVLMYPTFYEADSGTHPLFTSLYLTPPNIEPGDAEVTDTATLFILGAPYAEGASNRSLYVYSGDSVIRDRLGVGAVTKPDGSLTVHGPSGTAWTGHFRPLNKPAPYGVWIDEPDNAAHGYPLFQVTDHQGKRTYFRIDSGGAIYVDGKNLSELFRRVEALEAIK